MEYENPVILALYPSSIGIGYACLQIPDHLFDFGITTSRPISNRKLLQNTEKFMDHYKPKLVLLREVTGARNGNRNDKLIEAISTLAHEKGLQVHRYTKGQIKDVFEVFGAFTKFEMAQKIVKMLPDLAPRAPKERKWYEKEDYNMTLFNAVSLAVTHTHLSEEYVHSALKNEP
jgi:Holliday junction resolvasome RuvABC endonuclease subunit